MVARARNSRIGRFAAKGQVFALVDRLLDSPHRALAGICSRRLPLPPPASGMIVDDVSPTRLSIACSYIRLQSCAKNRTESPFYANAVQLFCVPTEGVVRALSPRSM